MLTRVTITGADDEVNGDDLRHLSEAYPFVEWGILLSNKRWGTPRYPSKKWLERFQEEQLWLHAVVQASAHLCGQCSRDTQEGDGWWLAQLVGFGRIQLNGFLPPLRCDRLAQGNGRPFEFILQAGTPEALVYASELEGKLGPKMSVLWDPSGGRGTAQTTWPDPIGTAPLSYAGGINPDNVEEVLRELAKKPYEIPYGIDMESGVRTDDRFDFSKVTHVLEVAKKHIEAASCARPSR